MKRVLIFMICMIFLAGVASAQMAFDNVKSYDAETKTVTITNAFGFGDDIAKVKLETPLTYYVVPNGIRKVAEMEVEVYDLHSDFFDKMEFYDLNNEGEEFIRNFVYKQKVITGYKTLTHYKTECTPTDIKGNVSDVCNNLFFSNETTEVVEWIPLDQTKGLQSGKITIGVFTFVKEGDFVEWIPTFNVGSKERLTEFATWSDLLNEDLLGCWKMNQTYRDTAFESYANPAWNMTMLNNSGSYNVIAGKISNALNATNRNHQGLKAYGNANLGSTQIAQYMNGSNPFSVSMWVKVPVDSLSLGDGLFGIGHNSEGGDGYSAVQFTDAAASKPEIGFEDGDGTRCRWRTTDPHAPKDVWTHIVAVFNGSLQVNGATTIYINGTSVSLTQGNTCGAGQAVLNKVGLNLTIIDGIIGSTADYTYAGAIDEVAFWNKELTAANALDLYNDGQGLSCSGGTSINLISPASSFETLLGTYFFSGNLSGGTELANATLKLWDNTQALYKSNFTTLSGIVNGTNLSIENIGFGTYNWNYVFCQDSALGGLCFTADNRTFTRNTFIENSVSFNEIALEKSTQELSVNITYANDIFSNIAGTLFYNGTAYTGSQIGTGNNLVFTRNLTMPDVGSVYSVDFYWELTLNNGTDNKFNTTAYEQNITPLLLTINCSAGNYVLYNFTIFDEKTQAKINPTSFNTSVEVNSQIYTLDRADGFIFLNDTFSKNNSFALCLDNNLSTGERYSLDLQMQYKSNHHAAEMYHISNATISSSSLYTNISLYDLINTSVTEFKIIYKDANLLPVEGALIQVQRRYVGEDVYKTVEIPKTDANGETLVHLEKDDVIYTFIVTKNGQILGTFNNIIPICQTPTLTGCIINLKSSITSIPTEDYTNIDGLSYTLTYNETTRTITSIFSVADSVPVTMLLNVTLADSLATTNICGSGTTELTSASGTLNCIIPSTYGNGTAWVNLYKDGELISRGLLALDQDGRDTFGGAIIFITIFLFMTLIGIGISGNPMVTGLFLIIGAVIAVALNLVGTGVNTFIGAGATILWIIIAIILVLIKSQNRT